MTRRRRWTFAAAVAVAALLLAFVVRRGGDASRVGAALAEAAARPGWLAAGVALFSVSLSCGLLRWYVLLRTLRLPVGFRDALRLYATGHFFNVLGPGATGGDLVKGAWIAAKCPGRRAEAVASIAAERIVGLLAMIALVTVLVTVRADFFGARPALRHLRRLVYVGAAVAAACVALLALVDVGAIAARLHPREGGAAARALDVAVRLWRTVRVCVVHGRASAVVFGLSLLNHATDMCCYLLLSRALGMEIAFRDLMVVSPVSNTVASVPVTPGGAGVREATMQYLLGAAGVPPDQGAALPLLMFAVIVFWAFICGLLAVRRPRS